MTALLLALSLCWTPNTEPDLLGYWVTSAERHVVEWVVCPCEPGVPCPQHILCPVYNQFQWQAFFTGYVPRFERACADEPGAVCYYRHPRAQDIAGNMSPEPDLLWPPPARGGCP